MSSLEFKIIRSFKLFLAFFHFHHQFQARIFSAGEIKKEKKKKTESIVTDTFHFLLPPVSISEFSRLTASIHFLSYFFLAHPFLGSFRDLKNPGCNHLLLPRLIKFCLIFLYRPAIEERSK